MLFKYPDESPSQRSVCRPHQATARDHQAGHRKCNPETRLLICQPRSSHVLRLPCSPTRVKHATNRMVVMTALL